MSERRQQLPLRRAARARTLTPVARQRRSRRPSARPRLVAPSWNRRSSRLSLLPSHLQWSSRHQVTGSTVPSTGTCSTRAVGHCCLHSQPGSPGSTRMTRPSATGGSSSAGWVPCIEFFFIIEWCKKWVCLIYRDRSGGFLRGDEWK